MDVMTPEQFAKRFHLDPDTVYRYLRNGVIPNSKKIGGVWRISTVGTQQWIRSWGKESAEESTPGA